MRISIVSYSVVPVMIEKLWFRMPFLTGAAALGVWLSGLDVVVYFFADCLTGRYATSIKLMLLGLPLFSALWFLRNHDVQSRFAQGEENRRQSELFAAFGWLAGATVAEKVLGLVELKRLRDLYPEFQERIDKATRTGVEMVKIGTSRLGSETVKETAVLVGVDLSGMDLSNIVLRGAKMDGVILEGTKLHDAKLKGVQMPNAKLKGAEFHKADCTGQANFTGAEVAGTKFIGTILEMAKLENIKNMKNTDFTGANMQNAWLTGSELSGGIWKNADMFRVEGVNEEQIEYLKNSDALRLLET